MSTLPADSHTARRLEHATPEHLHLTTRRAFVGPIPEGWLNSHRKSWYRHYIPGGRNRAPTFTAAQPLPAADRLNTQAPSVEAVPEEAEEAPRSSSQSAPASAPTTSTTSLLHGQRPGAVGGISPQNESMAVSTQPSDGRLPRKPSILSPLDRVASKLPTPKVRFNDSTRFQLRARAQRLAGRGGFRSKNFKDGEVLKMDRMLVRIDITQQSIGQDFDEKVSLGVEAKSLDKWREYMVVARAHVEDDASTVLQLYQTRVIAATAAQQEKTKKKPKIQILLSPGRARANLYSSLDKTLCVWTTEKARTTIYYLRAQSAATAVDWYTYLRTALGWKRAQTLQINVPDLSVSLRLDNPFKALEASKNLVDAAEGDDEALERALSDEKGAAGAIVARCVDMLKQSPEWTDVLNAWAQYDRIGLAWKRYDRLEWVHGAVEQRMYGTIAMSRTHDLELRPKDHYPLKTKTHKGAMLEEPPPVEGFLVRLTSQKGQELKMGKMLFKRLYFTSQNQYLLFLRPARAVPPPPPRLSVQSNGKVPTTKQLTDGSPLTYDIDPYPLDGKHVAWLDPDVRSAAEQTAHDKEAEDEFYRNSKMVLACDGFINLCEIRRVRELQKGATPADQNLEDGSDVEFDFEAGQLNQQSRRDDGATTEVDEDRTFELLMQNGLVVRLQAYSKTAKQEWMRRLRDLARYWRHRAKADMELYKSVREQNLETLQIDERAEAAVGSFAYKWEVGQSYASPLLYNMCGIARCRTIHLSGLLFRKPRRHATFTRCHVILSDGHLLIFQDTLRSRSGKKLVHIQHERIAAISLEGCYLYSGLLTENDLLYQNRTFDSNTPGQHALPRVYLEDGWTSTDEDAMTTFVIWHAKSKSWFRSSQTVDDVRSAEDAEAREKREEGGGKKMKLTRVNQLGTTGRSVVFKARSRVERDHWVMGLQVEIERLAAEELARGEDVRLEGGGEQS